MNYLLKQETLTNISDAIRERSATSEEYNPLEMPDAIRSIPSGAVIDDDNISTSTVFSSSKTMELVELVMEQEAEDVDLITQSLEGIRSQTIYSLDNEIRIGTWVDGKAIYRRVYKITEGIANDNPISVGPKPDGMSELINSRGIVKGAATTKNSFNCSEILVYVNDDGITCKQTFTNYADYMYVILEYTKN